MSVCIGICQLDDFGYCIGCGRTQAEIDGGEPDAPAPADVESARGAAVPHPLSAD